MEQNQPTRVLHILKNMQRGGVEQYLLNQYHILNIDNVQFDFCLYGPDQSKNDAYLMERFQSMGSQFYYLPYPNKHFWKFKKAFEYLLKEKKYQIVHCHQNLFSGFILPIAKAAKVPVRIAHAHTSKERKKLTIQRKLYTNSMRWHIKRASTHRVGASLKANEFVFGSNKEAVFLPNGIELDEFMKMSQRNLRKELNLPLDSQLIGHVGRFKPIKNHTFLLEIFQEYTFHNSKAHLILIGEGEELQNMKQYAQELGIKDKVHFLGNQDGIAGLLANLDLFLFPSLFEGLGISLIEAQAAGIRSLASSAIPNEVDLGLGLITFVDLDQREVWIDKMSVFLSEQYKKLSVEERRNVIESTGFDNQTSARRLKNIYDEAKRN